jgi:tetratricopeptide (TPR) repeat protein
MAVSIDQAMIDAEAARATHEHPHSLDKRDLMFAAKAPSLAQNSKASHLARIALNDRALALDPNYVWALRKDAFNLASFVSTDFSSNREADLARATNAADRALLLAPNDVRVLRSKAFVLRVQRNLDEAAALLHRVIELAPQWGWARRDLGQILLVQGHYKEALENFVSAKRLISVTGVDSVAFVDWALAMGLLVNDRFKEAIAQAKLAIAAPRGIPLVGADRSRKRRWAGRGGACGLAEVPCHPAELAHHGRDPEVRLLRRQSETA